MAIITLKIQYNFQSNHFWHQLSRVKMTIDGVGIGDLICWPHKHSRLESTLTNHWHIDYCPQPITVSTRCFLATDFNTGSITVSLIYSLLISHIKSSLHSRPFNWEPLHLTVATNRPCYNISHGLAENTALFLWCLDSLLQRWRNRWSQKTPLFYCCTIVAFVYLAAGTCLPYRCLETALVYFIISRLLHGNCSTCYIVLFLECFALQGNRHVNRAPGVLGLSGIRLFWPNCLIRELSLSEFWDIISWLAY
jgi:hypothetical protein